MAFNLFHSHQSFKVLKFKSVTTSKDVTKGKISINLALNSASHFNYGWACTGHVQELAACEASRKLRNYSFFIFQPWRLPIV